MAEPFEMPFGLWSQIGCRNCMLLGGPMVLRDVAMATSFGTQFGLTGFGYNFGCIIASDTLFDSGGVFSGSSNLTKT